MVTPTHPQNLFLHEIKPILNCFSCFLHTLFPPLKKANLLKYSKIKMPFWKNSWEIRWHTAKSKNLDCMIIDYVIILPNPVTHPVINHNHLPYPTHPVPCLRNIWMVPNVASILIPIMFWLQFGTNSKVAPSSIIKSKRKSKCEIKNW